MKLPRSTAFISVLILIGILSLVIIGITNGVGTAMTHGPNMEHVAGVITNIAPDKSFTIKTARGVIEHFQCSEHCLNAIPHMQRHVNERANTDIYYMQAANGTLIAVDVD